MAGHHVGEQEHLRELSGDGHRVEGVRDVEGSELRQSVRDIELGVGESPRGGEPSRGRVVEQNVQQPRVKDDADGTVLLADEEDAELMEGMLLPNTEADHAALVKLREEFAINFGRLEERRVTVRASDSAVTEALSCDSRVAEHMVSPVREDITVSHREHVDEADRSGAPTGPGDELLVIGLDVHAVLSVDP